MRLLHEYRHVRFGGAVFTNYEHRFAFSLRRHVVLIPQAAFFYACFGAQICVFHEFHAPHASETPALCFPNVLGLKSIRNCRFQPKTRDFLQKLHVSVKYVSRSSKYHVASVLLFKIRVLIFRNLPKTHVSASYSP